MHRYFYSVDMAVDSKKQTLFVKVVFYKLLISKYNYFCTKTLQSNKSIGRAGPESSYLVVMHRVIHRICG